MFWLSHTLHQFAYKQFKQVLNDYSGNDLPGTAPHILSSGIDLQARNGLSGAITYYFSDRIPLNDANSQYADAYHLVGLKIGYQRWFNNMWKVKLMAGVD